MVDEGQHGARPLPSFCGLSGEEDFRAQIAGITAQAEPTETWLQALAPVLRQLVGYDALWLCRWDATARRYRPLLEDGDVEPLRELFASEIAASDIEQLGFLQPGWPRLGHMILPALTTLRGWSEYLAPAGFRDGVGMGLRTSDGRHVRYLTLLTYRAGHVPATAAALLHSANCLIGDAVDRSDLRGGAGSA